MRIVFCHGMNELDKSGADLLNDWNSRLFGKTPVPNTSMAFWGDLSVAQSRALTVEDKLLCELYKLSTSNHFLGDCNKLFYDQAWRQDVLDRFLNLMTAEPTIVIAHSLGTVISYLALHSPKQSYDVPLYVTIGSPLGMPIVRAEVNRLGFPCVIPGSVSKWLNFSDQDDIVAIVHKVAPYFTQFSRASDIIVKNPFAPSHAHDIDGYLQTPEIRAAITQLFKP